MTVPKYSIGESSLATIVEYMCETSTDRVLDIVEIESAGSFTILDLPGIKLLGRNAVEITTSILDVVERETGARPKTLSIEVIDSKSMYRSLLDEYSHSLHHLKVGDCSRESKGSREKDYEEKYDKIRREELSRSVV